MARFNPYEYQDPNGGVIRKSGRLVKNAAVGLAAATPQLLPRAAVGVAVGKSHTAYRKGVEATTKRAAMETVARSRQSQEYARLKAIADKETAAAKSAANKASLRARVMANRTVEPTKVAQSAWDMAKQQQAESAARIADAKAGMGKRIEAAKKAFRGARDKAAKPVKTNMPAVTKERVKLPNGQMQNVRVVDKSGRMRTVQNFAKPQQLAKAQSAFDTEFRAAKSAMRTEVASARADYQAGRDILAGALREKRKADFAFRSASDAAKAAAKNVGDVAVTGERLARQSADWVYKSSMSGAPTVTGGQRAAMATADAFNAAGRGVKGAAVAVKDAASRLISKVNPFASKAEILARLSGSKAGAVANGASAAAKTAGGLVGKAVSGTAKAAGIIAKAPVKGIAGAFNAVEKAGQIVAGTGKAANLIRGLTNASGLAGGFAAGAWIDAGVAMHEFYKNGGKLSDVGKQRIETINGKQVAVHNPGWGDIVFSKDFWKEVAKSLQKNLTLGLTDGAWIDKATELTDEERKAEADRINAEMDSARENMRDIHGNLVYSPEQLAAERDALAKARKQSADAQEFLKKTKGSLDVQNFNTMLGQIRSERDAAFKKIDDNVRTFGDFSKTLRRPMTEEQYRESATANAQNQYDRRLNMLLGNSTAQEVMKANRRNAYAHYGVGTGDYDADVAGATGDRLEELKTFNRMWNDMSDADRVTWTKEDSAKAMAEVEASANGEEEQ